MGGLADSLTCRACPTWDKFSLLGFLFMVLLLDDDAQYLDLYRRILRVHEVQSAAFTLAEDALASFARQPHLYDAAILDVFLPTSQVDGLTVAQTLQHRRPGLPVLFITGLEDDANIARLQGVGQYQRKRTTEVVLAGVLYDFVSGA